MSSADSAIEDDVTRLLQSATKQQEEFAATYSTLNEKCHSICTAAFEAMENQKLIVSCSDWLLKHVNNRKIHGDDLQKSFAHTEDFKAMSDQYEKMETFDKKCKELHMHFQKAHDHSQMCLDNIKDVVVKTAWEEPLLSVFVSLSDALDTNFLANATICAQTSDLEHEMKVMCGTNIEQPLESTKESKPYASDMHTMYEDGKRKSSRLSSLAKMGLKEKDGNVFSSFSGDEEDEYDEDVDSPPKSEIFEENDCSKSKKRKLSHLASSLRSSANITKKHKTTDSGDYVDNEESIDDTDDDSEEGDKSPDEGEWIESKQKQSKWYMDSSSIPARNTRSCSGGKRKGEGKQSSIKHSFLLSSEIAEKADLERAVQNSLLDENNNLYTHQKTLYNRGGVLDRDKSHSLGHNKALSSSSSSSSYTSSPFILASSTPTSSCQHNHRHPCTESSPNAGSFSSSSASSPSSIFSRISHLVRDELKSLKTSAKKKFIEVLSDDEDTRQAENSKREKEVDNLIKKVSGRGENGSEDAGSGSDTPAGINRTVQTSSRNTTMCGTDVSMPKVSTRSLDDISSDDACDEDEEYDDETSCRGKLVCTQETDQYTQEQNSQERDDTGLQDSEEDTPEQSNERHISCTSSYSDDQDTYSDPMKDSLHANNSTGDDSDCLSDSEPTEAATLTASICLQEPDIALSPNSPGPTNMMCGSANAEDNNNIIDLT